VPRLRGARTLFWLGVCGTRRLTPRCARARQVIDDTKHVTLVGLGSVSGDVKKALENDKRSATKNKACTAPQAPRRARRRRGAAAPRAAAFTPAGREPRHAAQPLMRPRARAGRGCGGGAHDCGEVQREGH
jgi:hypothetical protein